MSRGDTSAVTNFCPACYLQYDEPQERCDTCRQALIPWEPRFASEHPVRGARSKGTALLLGLHLLQTLALLFAPLALFFVGLTQLVYVVPAAIVLLAQGKTDTLAGLLIGAGVTFGLNAALFGIVCGGLMSSV